jgi:predicted DNA-binding transcriptional regulator AlpA
MNGQSQTDFLLIPELARRTGFEAKTFYNAHSSGTGPFAEILVKLGGRLGVWRADYDLLVTRNRRLKDTAP